MEQIIDGYWKDHPVVITKRWRDSARGIDWVRVKCVDGTLPFLKHGYYSSHYEDETSVRLDLFTRDNAFIDELVAAKLAGKE